MMNVTMLLAVVFPLAFLSACVSGPNHPKDGEAPKISDSWETDDAVAAALEFGGKTLADTKALIKHRKEEKRVSTVMEQKLLRVSSLSESEVINAMHLYMNSLEKASVEVFSDLVASDREVDRILAWNLAANYPDPAIAAAIDNELTKRVSANDEKTLFVPQMAIAVQANRLTSAYTILRMGLMERGDDAFARAMIALAPTRVSEDFLKYLSKASVEELRQLNQTTINVFACLVILKFFTVNSAPLADKNASILFLYAVSRNQGLSEMAIMALDRIMLQNRGMLAGMLAAQPAWIQLAFVEDAKRRKNPSINLFMSDLAKVTGYDEVNDEIQTR